MWKEAVVGTDIIFYLMLGVGTVGVLAKVLNYFTLRRMVKAAGSMPKSTHKLMKLVRAKYEHACMIHDRVENVDAFVEKYIYEYRGAGLKIHTWRQIQIQSIWFSGILAAIGAFGHFVEHAFCEQIFQYGAAGAAEMIALFVISQVSDESYKIEAAKNYMVDYLENVCAHKYRRVRQTEKNLDVITSEATNAQRAADQQRNASATEDEPKQTETGIKKAGQKLSGARRAAKRSMARSRDELSIQIEGEPKRAGEKHSGKERTERAGMDELEWEGEVWDEERTSGYEPEKSAEVRQSEVRRLKEELKESSKKEEAAGEEPALKEEAIRQILEEFLA